MLNPFFNITKNLKLIFKYFSFSQKSPDNNFSFSFLSLSPCIINIKFRNHMLETFFPIFLSLYSVSFLYCIENEEPTQKKKKLNEISQNEYG